MITKLLQFISGAFLAAFTISQANAILLNVYSVDQFGAQTTFENSLYNYSVEDFEGYDLSGGANYGDPITTSVGTFAATGSDGTGACTNCDQMVILNDSLSPFSGRYDTTDGNGDFGGDGQWLDSNDISELTWSLSLGGRSTFDAFGFMLMDPADVGASLTISLLDGTTIFETINFRESNGSLFYITGILDELATSATITLANSSDYTNDGFGIDDVVIGSIPEPSILAMLGTGLLILTVVHRKKT